MSCFPSTPHFPSPWINNPRLAGINWSKAANLLKSEGDVLTVKHCFKRSELSSWMVVFEELPDLELKAKNFHKAIKPRIVFHGRRYAAVQFGDGAQRYSSWGQEALAYCAGYNWKMLQLILGGDDVTEDEIPV